MRLPLILVAALLFAPSASFSADAAKKPCRDEKGRLVRSREGPGPLLEYQKKKFAKCSAPDTGPRP
jgi:hypothetical protein